MAALPVISGAYLIVATGHWNAQPSGNTFCWKTDVVPSSDAIDSANADLLAASLHTRLNVLYNSCLQNTYVGDLVKVYPLGSPLVPPSTAVNSSTGGISGQLAPAPTTMVIRHEVNRRGRGSQGHTSLSPVSMNWVHSDGLVLETTNVDIVTAAWNTFVADVTTDTAATSAAGKFVQLSTKGSGAVYSILTSACDPFLGTERSRARRP